MFVKDSKSSVTKERSNTSPLLVQQPTNLHLSNYVYAPNKTLVYDTVPSPAGLTYSYEMITYDTGSQFFKNCTHLSTVRTALTSGTLLRSKEFKHYYTNPATYYTEVNYPGWYYSLAVNAIPGHPSSPTTGLLPPILTDLEGSLQRAALNMMPRMEDITGGLNLINFILELRDAKMMFKLWKRSYGVLKNLSAGILNVSYAWQPFIRDLETIHNKLLRVNDYLDRWNKDAKAGVIYTRHADITSDVWKTNQSYSSTSNPSYATWVTGWTSRYPEVRSLKEKVVVKAHLAFKPSPIDVSGFNKIAAYADLIGLGDPLSIIWEAIPFSFLVDYFLSVQRFLSQFDTDFFVTPITLVDFGYSVKSEQKYTYEKLGYFKKDSSGQVYSGSSGQSMYIRKVYERRRIGLPSFPNTEGSTRDVDFGLLEFRWPSWRQAFLMMNLANVLRR